MRIDLLFGWTMMLITFYFYPANYWRSVWWDKWFLVMAACTVFWAYKLGRRFHWSVGTLSLVILMSALWGYGWRPAYAGLDFDQQLAIKEIGAYTYASFTILSLLAYFSDAEMFDTAVKFTAGICLLNASYINGQWLWHIPAQARGGFFGNPSMSGCLLAFSLPLLMSRIRAGEDALMAFFDITCVLVVLTAIFLTGASQPVGVLLVVVVAIWTRSMRPCLSDFLAGAFLITIACLTLLMFSTYRLHEGIFDSSGRFFVQHQGLVWWWKYGNHWLGMGTGLTQILLPLIQREALPQVVQAQHLDLYMWFHSDWLQLLFENGVVGLASGLVMYGCALRIAWRKAPWLFASVVGVGATALFNFPVHFPMHALIAVFIFAMAFDRKYLLDANSEQGQPTDGRNL